MVRLESKVKDNPKLGQTTLKDGRVSLYLEYYLGRVETPVVDEWGEPVLYTDGKMVGKPKYKITHNRRKEGLNLYLLAKPRTPSEREENRQVLEIANKIRAEREQELKENKNGYRLRKDEAVVDFIAYFQTYIDANPKHIASVRMLKLALSRFVDFLNDTPEYRVYVKGIKPERLDKEMMEDFADYLQSRSKGEGAKTLFQRFKVVVNYAVEHNVLKKNPCKDVVIKVDKNILRKDILSQDEIKTLWQTNYEKQNQEVRRAFMFCLFTGLRFCDVKALTYSNVDFSNKLLKFEQSKTKGGVEMYLRDDLLALIGKPEDEEINTPIFNLPSYEMCLKSLGKWVKRAGINKHISWHCARHSFATNILSNGANVVVVANLLGHSSLQHTEKYLRAVDKLKKEALESLPKITL